MWINLVSNQGHSPHFRASASIFNYNMPSPLVVIQRLQDFIPPLALLVISIRFYFIYLFIGFHWSMKVNENWLKAPTHPLRICMWPNGRLIRITAPAGTIFGTDFTYSRSCFEGGYLKIKHRLKNRPKNKRL